MQSRPLLDAKNIFYLTPKQESIFYVRFRSATMSTSLGASSVAVRQRIDMLPIKSIDSSVDLTIHSETMSDPIIQASDNSSVSIVH